MKNNNLKLALPLVLGLGSFSILPFSAQASGFRIPEISIAGIGTSNALVADTKTSGALPYNPAAMSFHEEGGLVFGLAQIRPKAHVDPSAGNATDSQGEVAVYVPNIFVMNHLNEEWSWGIGVNVPFGLETKWPAGTFGTFPSPALEPEHSKLEMINVQGNLAFKVSSQTSIAVGVNQYIVKTLIFNTQLIEIEGDGNNHGWNIGLQHLAGPWSFGLAYRPGITVDLKGHVDTGSTKSSARAELAFPSLLQTGARYQANPLWAFEMDVERTGWSSFEVVEIEHSSPGISNPIRSTNKWNNSYTYRLGAAYELSQQTQLRLGYALDKTPQDDDFFSARIPDNDRQTLSMGIAHAVNGWLIEGGYMYVWLKDRRVDAPSGSFNFPANTDPNGTDAYNGKYQSSAHVLGLGVSTRF
jgi:long-chain fatty acid transport protein